MTRLWTAAVCATLLHTQQPSPPASAWPPEGVYRMEAVDTLPRLIKQVKPGYSGDAIRARIEGVVYAACVVNADGTVGDIRITKSLDSRFGSDDAAIAALRQWTFSPALKDGRPVPVAIEVEMAFTLAGVTRVMSWPAGFAPPSDPTDTT